MSRSSGSSSSLSYRLNAQNVVAHCHDPYWTRGVVASKSELNVLKISDDTVTLQAQLCPAVRFSRLAAFRCVAWGYNYTDHKIASGQSNGTVALWDAAVQMPSRAESSQNEHNRAVNQVVFAGQGSWLFSAGQDGNLHLWDIRSTESTVALTCFTATDACRALAVHPHQAAPSYYYLCSLGESGLLYHWDIRRPYQAVDRIQSHVGEGTCLAWKQVGEKSWLASGGLDHLVKIWEHAEGSLSPKPIYSLSTGHSSQSLAWRPDRDLDLAVVPLYTMSINSDSSTNINLVDEDAERKAPWTNEVEMWTIERPHSCQSILRSAEGTVTSGTVFHSHDSIWCLHRNSSRLVKRSLQEDFQRPLSSLPSACVTFSIRNDLAFASARLKQDLGMVKLKDSPGVEGLDPAHHRTTYGVNQSKDEQFNLFSRLSNLIHSDASHLRRQVAEMNTSEQSQMNIGDSEYPVYRYQSPSKRTTPSSRPQSADVSRKAESLDMVPSVIEDDYADDEKQLELVRRPNLTLQGSYTTEAIGLAGRSMSEPRVPASWKRGLDHPHLHVVDRSSTDEEEEAVDSRIALYPPRFIRTKSGISVLSNIRPGRPKTRLGHAKSPHDPGSQVRADSAEHDLARKIVEEAINEGDLELGLSIAHFTGPLSPIRAQTALITLLDRLGLDIAAADARKSGQALSTQSDTLLSVGCGSCGKALLNSPFARCNRCEAWLDTCVICHRSRSNLFCPICGHSAHDRCIMKETAESPGPSRPSTPNLISAWSWLDGLTHVPSECPSGCGHENCPLGVV